MSGTRARSGITSGCDMPGNPERTPEWERLLSSAAHLQEILPGAVLVGGTAAALHAEHRFSMGADHVLTDLRDRFDGVLAQLESVAGWKTARLARPVQILGSLDGILTGIRQLIRTEPLETTKLDFEGVNLTVPTEAEILRKRGSSSSSATPQGTTWISWPWPPIWARTRPATLYGHSTGSILRKAASPPCNNSRPSWPIHCRTISRSPACPSTETLPRDGRTGGRSGPCADV